MKSILKTLTLCALTAACFAQATELTFESVDADQNGYISMTEADSHEALKEQFKKLDTDEDGQLSPEEFKSFAN